MRDISPSDILTFWFGEDPAAPLARRETWFKKDPAFDAEVTARFGDSLALAPGGAMAEWWHEPESALAFIILTDQFPRNIHRDTPDAFRFDPLALHCSLTGQARGLDTALSPVMRYFFIMPLMHAESLEIQARSVAAFTALADACADAPEDVRKTLESALDYAKAHRDVVERFGRFPHRNAILGRENTPAEAEYLAKPGAGF